MEVGVEVDEGLLPSRPALNVKHEKKKATEIKRTKSQALTFEFASSSRLLGRGFHVHGPIRPVLAVLQGTLERLLALS